MRRQLRNLATLIYLSWAVACFFAEEAWCRMRHRPGFRPISGRM